MGRYKGSLEVDVDLLQLFSHPVFSTIFSPVMTAASSLLALFAAVLCVVQASPTKPRSETELKEIVATIEPLNGTLAVHANFH